MTDNRKLKRWKLIYALRIFESGSDAPVGHVDDINESGMMIVGDKAFTPKEEYSFWMEVPMKSGELEHVELRGRCAWTEVDEEYELNRNGFELHDVEALVVVAINCLIDELAFEEK